MWGGRDPQSPASQRRGVMRVNVEEKLAAILVADVADYERLIARDRGEAHAALQL